jgi:hypothetical protein
MPHRLIGAITAVNLLLLCAWTVATDAAPPTGDSHNAATWYRRAFEANEKGV